MRGDEPAVGDALALKADVNPTCVGMNRIPMNTISALTALTPHAWG